MRGNSVDHILYGNHQVRHPSKRDPQLLKVIQAAEIGDYHLALNLANQRYSGMNINDPHNNELLLLISRAYCEQYYYQRQEYVTVTAQTRESLLKTRTEDATVEEKTIIEHDFIDSLASALKKGPTVTNLSTLFVENRFLCLKRSDSRSQFVQQVIDLADEKVHRALAYYNEAAFAWFKDGFVDFSAALSSSGECEHSEAFRLLNSASLELMQRNHYEENIENFIEYFQLDENEENLFKKSHQKVYWALLHKLIIINQQNLDQPTLDYVTLNAIANACAENVVDKVCKEKSAHEKLKILNGGKSNDYLNNHFDNLKNVGLLDSISFEVARSFLTPGQYKDIVKELALDKDIRLANNKKRSQKRLETNLIGLQVFDRF